MLRFDWKCASNPSSRVALPLLKDFLGKYQFLFPQVSQSVGPVFIFPFVRQAGGRLSFQFRQVLGRGNWGNIKSIIELLWRQSSIMKLLWRLKIASLRGFPTRSHRTCTSSYGQARNSQLFRTNRPPSMQILEESIESSIIEIKLHNRWLQILLINLSFSIRSDRK